MADIAPCPLPQPQPRPGYEPLPGREWATVPSASWRPGGEGRDCSASRCPHQGVAILTRRVYYRRHGLGDRRYAYCGCHLGAYRVWIEDGQVIGWQAREVAADG